MDLFPKGRTYKLDDRGAAAVREQLEAFRRKFGREPGPGDPLFFDPDAEVPRRISLVKFDAEVTQGMEKAGLPPQFIYAYRKTGRVVTELNMKNLSKLEIEEWNAAVDEYFESHA
jgi:hypothetical protein